MGMHREYRYEYLMFSIFSTKTCAHSLSNGGRLAVRQADNKKWRG